MSGLNRLIWLLVVLLGIYIGANQNKPVWFKAGDFLNHNATQESGKNK